MAALSLLRFGFLGTTTGTAQQGHQLALFDIKTGRFDRLPFVKAFATQLADALLPRFLGFLE